MRRLGRCRFFVVLCAIERRCVSPVRTPAALRSRVVVALSPARRVCVSGSLASGGGAGSDLVSSYLTMYLIGKVTQEHHRQASLECPLASACARHGTSHTIRHHNQPTPHPSRAADRTDETPGPWTVQDVETSASSQSAPSTAYPWGLNLRSARILAIRSRSASNCSRSLSRPSRFFSCCWKW